MEQELLELWSSVEKDKDARRQLAHATLLARQAQRAGTRMPKQVCALPGSCCTGVEHSQDLCWLPDLVRTQADPCYS